MSGTVVIFDFDNTIIDIDSDNWVVDELGATDQFNQLFPTMHWNSLMDRMMEELHLQGKTIEDIKQVLNRVPIHPQIVSAIKARTNCFRCDLRVVSDANTLFIETVLKHLGILECFSEINTNPCFIDEEGRLRILPYHDSHNHKSPHGCTLCPPNMCKGKIIKIIQSTFATEEKKKIIYLGDGAGDFCPSLKLVEGDYMMPRRDFPVWDLICKNRHLVTSEVHEWSSGEDFERILLHLITSGISMEDMKNNVDNTNMSHSFDCKFETIALEA
ncbi:hypothetical protein L1987_52044 [Smallanthus sonchifolius]|uniref:Uncharacterized protein n=1 Tax=Smallanthus sonchifolius TaxID=185202 RepID=A0ACB9ESM5_9ASTR|nr:hypothetical protein L1987_52044 [Smallanthus sonchifolius]